MVSTLFDLHMRRTQLYIVRQKLMVNIITVEYSNDLLVNFLIVIKIRFDFYHYMIISTFDIFLATFGSNIFSMFLYLSNPFSLRVIALSMSPVDDIFLSGSLDNTIRLWDLKSPNCAVCFPIINLSASEEYFSGSDASEW